MTIDIRQKFAIATLAILLSAGSATNSFSAADTGLTIDGQVQKTEYLTASDLQAFSATSVSVSFVTGHGQESGNYTGVLLWTLLGNASITDPDPKLHPRRAILVTSGARSSMSRMSK